VSCRGFRCQRIGLILRILFGRAHSMIGWACMIPSHPPHTIYPVTDLGRR
jgi:hypothetical protein